MEKLSIPKTQNTPEILLDPEKRVVEFTGRSYPENTFEIFGPIFDWLKEYFEEKSQEKTVVNMDIDYFNSSSSRSLYEFFTVLNDAVKNGHEIEVNWIYDEEDESTKEDGEDFREDFADLGIKLVKK